jgi:hypothetical protein
MDTEIFLEGNEDPEMKVIQKMILDKYKDLKIKDTPEYIG